MQDPTLISVVIPCRNERDHIEICVESILAQRCPGVDIEVIVADGMSDDGTREILARLAMRSPRLTIVDNVYVVTPCGMNAGIRNAHGRYIAIVGAHNRYPTNYLRHCLEVIEETGADNVGGVMICEGHTRVQKAIAAAHHSVFSVGGARWHNIDYEGPADTVFGGFYRREVFDRLGLMDEELVRNQDDEFNLRLTRSGGKIWQSSRVRSWYTPRSSLTNLSRQYMQYGYWKVRVIQKHKLPASVRQIVPGFFVFSLFVLAVASLRWPHAAALLIGLVGGYAICNVAASVVTAARKGWSLLPLLPPVFACYHFAYGYGFLRGGLDFFVLGRKPQLAVEQLTRT